MCLDENASVCFCILGGHSSLVLYQNGDHICNLSGIYGFHDDVICSCLITIYLF